MQPIFSIQNQNALRHLNIDKSIGLPNPYWLCSLFFQSKTKMHCVILILTSQSAFQILTGYAANFSIQNQNALRHLNIDKSIGLPNPYWLCSLFFQSKTKMHCVILILTSQSAFQILTGYAANFSIQNQNALHHLNIDKSIGLPNPYWLCSLFFQSKTKMHCIILILTSQSAFQILTGYAAYFSIQNQNALHHLNIDKSIGLPNPYWLCSLFFNPKPKCTASS